MKQIRRIDGSITLESAIVMPAFVALMMVFVMIMKIILAQMALQQAVSQSVQVVAAYAYPLAVAQQSEYGQTLTNVSDQFQGVSEQLEQVADWLQSLESTVPSSISSQLTTVHDQIKQAVMNSIKAPVKYLMLPLVQSQMSKSIWLDEEKFVITDVELPNFQDRSQPYFGITGKYDMKISIPFYETTIELEAKAYERVWYAD